MLVLDGNDYSSSVGLVSCDGGGQQKCLHGSRLVGYSGHAWFCESYLATFSGLTAPNPFLLFAAKNTE